MQAAKKQAKQHAVAEEVAREEQRGAGNLIDEADDQVAPQKRRIDVHAVVGSPSKMLGIACRMLPLTVAIRHVSSCALTLLAAARRWRFFESRLLRNRSASLARATATRTSQSC